MFEREWEPVDPYQIECTVAHAHATIEMVAGQAGGKSRWLVLFGQFSIRCIVRRGSCAHGEHLREDVVALAHFQATADETDETLILSKGQDGADEYGFGVDESGVQFD